VTDLDELIAKHDVPGAQVAVLAGGEIHDEAAGVLSVHTGVETTTDAVFKIGSITKIWTATLVHQLVTEGVLDLDRPVRDHLPEFRLSDQAATESVTPRHLLTHTSGLAANHFAPARGIGEFVATLADEEHLLPPGTTHSYSNSGFVVLGRLVEVLRGKPFHDVRAQCRGRPARRAHHHHHRQPRGHVPDRFRRARPRELPAQRRRGVQDCLMVTVADIRAVALSLPRTTEHLIRDRVKFRVGKIVYAALSRDETVLGFGYPREEREALVASDPVKFAFPSESDMRFQWVHASMAELDVEEMTELVVGAWTMCVPKKVIRAHLGEDYL
jgi:hypothetical protein